jgi:NAD(P)-dependent dehydrogenase (short-subunit alcohol dehydrogenase family)
VSLKRYQQLIPVFQLGGGNGFGAAIAKRFGEEGAKVILTDINVEGGEKVAAQNPSNLIFKRQDVTNEGDWKEVVDLAFSKFGRLDVLVNNAGTTYRNKVGLYIPSLMRSLTNHP